MSANSKIEWTGRSDWNCIRGCTRKSHGCKFCYAEVIAGRFSDPGQPFHGFAKRTTAGARWTGKVEVVWDRLLLPLKWRKPAMIFGSSTSDLFHEALPADEIAQIYAVGIAAHHLRGHTIQWLTKRPERARSLLNDPTWWELVNSTAGELVMERTDPLNRRSDDARATMNDYGPNNPPPGTWLGTSVEDQAAADERIPHLLATPAAVRFLSCEPLLGSVDLTSIPYGEVIGNAPSYQDALSARIWMPAGSWDGRGHTVGDRTFVDLCTGINWVIVGGESGKGARPMPPDWARSLRDQCAAAGVPFFFKQWGLFTPLLSALPVEGLCSSDNVAWPDGTLGPGHSDERGGAGQWLYRAQKSLAGRLLDGVEHNGMPS